MTPCGTRGTLPQFSSTPWEVTTAGFQAPGFPQCTAPGCKSGIESQATFLCLVPCGSSRGKRISYKRGPAGQSFLHLPHNRLPFLPHSSTPSLLFYSLTSLHSHHPKWPVAAQVPSGATHSAQVSFRGNTSGPSSLLLLFSSSGASLTVFLMFSTSEFHLR
jgi:hypothetical protein